MLIKKLTFVLPAYSEAQNLPAVIPRLLGQEGVAEEIRVIVVDDHSPDSTFDVVREWSERDERVGGIRLARNSGSHMAIMAGLSRSDSDVVVVLAADGQDPPEFTPRLLEEWRRGAQVVWAVRTARQGETLATRLFSRLYYATMNRWTSVRLPPSGADFMLLDRRVVDVLRNVPERNTSILALITWLGFRQVEIPYVKEARVSGRSKWTLGKKLKLAADSMFGFSVAPLRIAAAAGGLFAAGGFVYAALLIINKLAKGALFGATPVEGWSALMVVLLISSGLILIVVGVLGEYLWRTLEEVRQRPRFAVEDEVNVNK